MENLGNAILIFNDRSFITYSIPDTPLYTVNEVDFWLVTGTERLLICKDSFDEIVSRGDYVIENSPTSLQKATELDKIAKLYSETFLSEHCQDMDFDRYIFFDGIGFTTWISSTTNTSDFYLRIDHVIGSRKFSKVFSGFIDKTEFLSWWNRVKFELRHLF